MPLPDVIEVIAPNIKRRLSGVTATIVRLVPIQARMIGIVATGPGLPDDLPHLPLWRVAVLPNDRWRVWHARRNIEMLLGLVLRHVLRRKLRLLFTSASQRRHTGYTKWLIDRMDRIVATSVATAGFMEKPSSIVMHGIDSALFAPVPNRNDLRARLGVPEGFIVGCYGRIRPSKGTDHFVHAMIRLLPDHPGVTALVMGRATSQFRGFHEGLIEEVGAAGLSDRILFLPEVQVDQMPDWYSALDLYVAPQRHEGFGLTPLEAMSCGVPVIATRTGAFESLVAPQAGRIVPADDLPALTSAIAEALANPSDLSRSGAAARAHVLAHHRIEDEAGTLVSIYRELLN